MSPRRSSPEWTPASRDPRGRPRVRDPAPRASSRALVAAETVDGPMLCGGHQHAPGLFGMPDCGQRSSRDERVVSQILRERDVADDPAQRRDQTRGLDAPNGLDGAPRVGPHHACAKSSGPSMNNRRISISPWPPSGWGLGTRSAQALASSSDFSSRMQ